MGIFNKTFGGDNMVIALMFCFGLLLGVIIGISYERKRNEKVIILGTYCLNPESNTIDIRVDEGKIIDENSDIVLKHVSYKKHFLF